MSWQEELRRLDAELAAGTISSGEHRRRREDILAEVSGAPLVSFSASPTAPGEPASPTEDTGQKRAERPEEAPGGPATNAAGDSGWQTTNPAQATAEPTSTASPTPPPSPRPAPVNAAALLSTTRPTTAPSPADERPTELIHFSHFSQPPPSNDPPVPSESDRPRRAGLTWVAISGAVFLALGAVIGGVWWLGQDRSEPPPPAAGASADAGVTPTGAQLADRLPTLPGEQSPNNSTMSVGRGAELGLYSEEAAEFLTTHGVTEVIARGSLNGSTDYLLLVLRTGSPAQAQEVTEYLYRVTLPEKVGHSEGPPRTASGVAGQRQVNGAWYASGENAVVLMVTQPTGGDQEVLADRLRRTLDSLKELLPVR